MGWRWALHVTHDGIGWLGWSDDFTLQGRSVRDVIHWGFAGPALFCFIWLSVFGGAGIRMERQVRQMDMRRGNGKALAGIGMARQVG